MVFFLLVRFLVFSFLGKKGAVGKVIFINTLHSPYGTHL